MKGKRVGGGGRGAMTRKTGLGMRLSLRCAASGCGVRHQAEVWGMRLMDVAEV